MPIRKYKPNNKYTKPRSNIKYTVNYITFSQIQHKKNCQNILHKRQNQALLQVYASTSINYNDSSQCKYF